MHYVLKLCAAALFLVIAPQAAALDIAITYAPLDDKDKLKQYIYKLIKESLEASKPEYGEYIMKLADSRMARDRQFTELIKGVNLSIIVSPPKTRWKQKALRVPFPIQKGIASYRIFFVMKKNKDILANVKTLEDLKKIPTGTNESWSTTKILRDHDFNVISAYGYQNLFEMLKRNRYLTLNRGINEIPIELRVFAETIPNMVFDKHIALYTYIPNYFYVSPLHPKLALRMEYGLKKLHKTGKLDKLFFQYYGQYLTGISLKGRRIFNLKNTNLEPGMYEHDKPYLLQL